MNEELEKMQRPCDAPSFLMWCLVNEVFFVIYLGFVHAPSIQTWDRYAQSSIVKYEQVSFFVNSQLGINSIGDASSPFPTKTLDNGVINLQSIAQAWWTNLQLDGNPSKKTILLINSPGFLMKYFHAEGQYL